MTIANVECARCNRTAPGAEKVTYGGALGDEIRAKVCNDCWGEWQNAEVMVINELRLNFMDPAAQDTLIRHLREFLALDGSTSGSSSPGGALPGILPPDVDTSGGSAGD